MNLSQDEINAMLAGQLSDKQETEDSAAAADAFDASSEFAGYLDPDAYNNIYAGETVSPDNYRLTPYEEDTLGEVGNMCMGAVATTMYTLLDRRVSITTPRVSVHTTKEVLAEYEVPFVIVEVHYTEGIEGKNLLLLKEPDAALITDLLMGGDGHIEEPVELNELHMSAISEIMNQMIGASATALSKLIHSAVNISPPKSDRVNIDADVSGMLDYTQVIVKVSFDMEIEGLLKSQLIQLMPFELARELARKLMEVYTDEETEESYAAPKSAPQPAPAPKPAPSYTAPPSLAQAPPPAYPAQHPDPAHMAAYSRPEPAAPVPGSLVDVRPMHFDSFDGDRTAPTGQKGMDIVYDIPLQVSVELGKTKKEINEILEFGMGTVIVLDKIAGDPVEILVNGKLIARGEVVVIDENYGVRITELFNK
jgi:flagellar motor switch protein FliN/FliY